VLNSYWGENESALKPKKEKKKRESFSIYLSFEKDIGVNKVHIVTNINCKLY
jgi:hypothetical protein